MKFFVCLSGLAMCFVAAITNSGCTPARVSPTADDFTQMISEENGFSKAEVLAWNQEVAAIQAADHATPASQPSKSAISTASKIAMARQAAVAAHVKLETTNQTKVGGDIKNDQTQFKKDQKTIADLKSQASGWLTWVIGSFYVIGAGLLAWGLFLSFTVGFTTGWQEVLAGVVSLCVACILVWVDDHKFLVCMAGLMSVGGIFVWKEYTALGYAQLVADAKALISKMVAGGGAAISGVESEVMTLWAKLFGTKSAVVAGVTITKPVKVNLPKA